MATKDSVSDVRAWAKQQGFELSDRGRLPAEVWAAWEARGNRRAVSKPRRDTTSSTSKLDEPMKSANVRIDRLEQLVADLTARLVYLESRGGEPRTLVGRALGEFGRALRL